MVDSDATRATPGAKRPLLSGKAIIAIVIAVVSLAFVFSNTAEASLHFLGLSFTMPAWGWFLAVLIAGVVIGTALIQLLRQMITIVFPRQQSMEYLMIGAVLLIGVIADELVRRAVAKRRASRAA